MYSVYKEILERSVISRLPYKNKIPTIEYLRGAPYIMVDFLCAIEGQSYRVIYDLLSKMLDMFGIFAYWQEKATIISKTDIKDIENGLAVDFDMILDTWGGMKMLVFVCKMNDLLLYENNGVLDRLLLLLLIDPLAFISRMREKINGSSSAVIKFFGILETSIGGVLYNYVIKYLLIKEIRETGVVNDIVLLVIDSWMRCEICSVEKKLKI